jgi:hypothetical protein
VSVSYFQPLACPMPQTFGTDFVDAEKVVVVDCEEYITRLYTNDVCGGAAGKKTKLVATIPTMPPV